MKTTVTLLAAAALGLAGAAVAQTSSMQSDNSMMNGSNGMSGKSMKHAKSHKHSSSSSTGSDTNGMRGSDMGAANGATPNGGDVTPTTPPSNGTTPQ